MRYLIFDTETGGFSSKEDALLSLGFIILNEELEEIDRFYSFIQNTENKNIKEEAIKENKITPEQIESGLLLSEVRDIWNTKTSNVDIFIAHKIDFDIGFLAENGFNIPANATTSTLDTMHVSWDIWPRPESAKLGEIYFRITGEKNEGAHNAIVDCEMVVEFLKWLKKNNKIRFPLSSFPIIKDYVFGYKQAMRHCGILPLTN